MLRPLRISDLGAGDLKYVYASLGPNEQMGPEGCTTLLLFEEEVALRVDPPGAGTGGTAA